MSDQTSASPSGNVAGSSVVSRDLFGSLIDSIAFESKEPDRGYTVRASYLKEPRKQDALIEIFKDGEPRRAFFFPAYKVWNIAAHFRDIVDGELENNARGYQMAAWDGISNSIVIRPCDDEPNTAVTECGGKPSPAVTPLDGSAR